MREALHRPGAAPRETAAAPPLRRRESSLQDGLGNRAVLSLLRSAATASRSSGVPASVHSALARQGVPLSDGDHAEMRERFGRDLSDVRIVDGTAAARSAADIGARAYSFGDKVVLGSPYRPGSDAARGMLAHELVHVAQQRGARGQPHGVERSDAPAEREASALGSDGGGAPSARAASGLVHRQQVPPPTPQTQTPQTQTPSQQASDQPPPAQPHPAHPPVPLTPELRERINHSFDQANFDIPLVVDDQHCFYNSIYRTLHWVRDLVVEDYNISQSDAWSLVWQYYNQKKLEAERRTWQFQLQLIWSPSLAFWSSQPGPAFSNSVQLGAGFNFRSHPAGRPGVETSLSLQGSFFNPGSGNVDFFQNALAQLQVGYVGPLGSEVYLGHGVYSLFQGSVFGQIAAGVGSSYADTPGGRRLAVGFMVQPGVGGQLSWNIGWFQVLLQGAIVYSYLSPTALSSSPTHTVGGQLGLGIGGQF